MSEEKSIFDAEELWEIAKIGLVSTAIGAPLGVWAHRRWPDEEWKTTVVLMAFGFCVRYVGMKMIDDEVGVAVEET